MKRIAFLLSVLVPIITLAQTAGPFSDITKESRFFVPVSFLKEKGFVSGYSDGAFHPEREVNRAEALAMMLQISGILTSKTSADNEKIVSPGAPLQISFPKSTEITIENLATGEKTALSGIQSITVDAGSSSTATVKLRRPGGKKPFQDVSEKDWFYDVVQEGKKRGIVKGKVQGKEKGKYFRPQDTVNLAEALRMLFQSASIQPHLSEGTLPEGIPADSWYAKDIAYAVKKTLLTQKQNGAIFPPHESLNRGEMALLLYRFLRMKEGASFGYASWYGDGLAKTKLTENKEYAEKYLTAAHRTFPFGTILHVTNMTNGKEVDVVVNDRGPFVTGRIIDLSKTAFSALESTSAGIISVQIYVSSNSPVH